MPDRAMSRGLSLDLSPSSPGRSGHVQGTVPGSRALRATAALAMSRGLSPALSRFEPRPLWPRVGVARGSVGCCRRLSSGCEESDGSGRIRVRVRTLAAIVLALALAAGAAGADSGTLHSRLARHVPCARRRCRRLDRDGRVAPERARRLRAERRPVARAGLEREALGHLRRARRARRRPTASRLRSSAQGAPRRGHMGGSAGPEGLRRSEPHLERSAAGS